MQKKKPPRHRADGDCCNLLYCPRDLSNTLPASKYKPVNGPSAVVGGGSLASSNRIVNQNANRPSFTTVLPSTSTVAFSTGVPQPNPVFFFSPSSWLSPMPI